MGDEDVLELDEDLKVIDESPDWEAYNPNANKGLADYASLAEMRNQAANLPADVAPEGAQAGSGETANLPAEEDNDTFEPPADGIDWQEKARKDFEKYYDWFGVEKDSIKTQDDFQLAQDRVYLLNTGISNDQQFQSLWQLRETPDKEFLYQDISEKNPYDSEDELQGRFTKFLDENGELSDRGKQLVGKLKADVETRLHNRGDEIRDMAKKEAEVRHQYRQNVVNYIPEFTPPPVSIELNGNKVQAEPIKLSKQDRYKLQQYISSGNYEQSLVGAGIQGEAGHKVKVENAFWSNPELRSAYLEKLFKSAYQQGQSDYIANKIIK